MFTFEWFMTNYYILIWIPMVSLFVLTIIGTLMSIIQFFMSGQTLILFYRCMMNLCLIGSFFIYFWLIYFLFLKSHQVQINYHQVNYQQDLQIILSMFLFKNIFFDIKILFFQTILIFIYMMAFELIITKKIWVILLWNCLFLSFFLIPVVNDLLNLYILLEFTMFITLFLFLEGQNTFRNEYSIISVESGLEYFFIQILGSFFILLGFLTIYVITLSVNFEKILAIFSYINYQENYKVISFVLIFLGLSIKLALFPFYGWFFKLLENLSYSNFFIFLSFSKLIYFYLIIFFSSVLMNFLESYSDLYFLIQFILFVNTLLFCTFHIGTTVSLKRFIGLSSIFLTVFLLFFIFTKHIFLYFLGLCYFVNYIIGFFLIFKFFEIYCAYSVFSNNIYLFNEFINNLKFSSKLIILVILLILTGFPPFLGFWIKLFLIYHSWIHSQYIIVWLFFIIITFIYYLYLTIILSIIEYKTQFKRNFSAKRKILEKKTLLKKIIHKEAKKKKDLYILTSGFDLNFDTNLVQEIKSIRGKIYKLIIIEESYNWPWIITLIMKFLGFLKMTVVSNKHYYFLNLYLLNVQSFYNKYLRGTFQEINFFFYFNIFFFCNICSFPLSNYMLHEVLIIFTCLF